MKLGKAWYISARNARCAEVVVTRIGHKWVEYREVVGTWTGPKRKVTQDTSLIERYEDGYGGKADVLTAFVQPPEDSEPYLYHEKPIVGCLYFFADKPTAEQRFRQTMRVHPEAFESNGAWFIPGKPLAGKPFNIQVWPERTA